MAVRITLLYSPAPREVFEQTLDLPDGVTAHAAVAASRLDASFPTLDRSTVSIAVWGRAVDWQRVLVDGDRVELCRALVVDPKVARRERFRRQGARATGLFAKRREGGKAGY